MSRSGWVEVGSKTINGINCNIVAHSGGSWGIEVDDEVIGSGESLDTAIAKARTALNKRKTKVEVQFITYEGEKGVATGFNSRDRRVLTVMEDGTKPQLGFRERVFKPDTPAATIREYISKTAKREELRRELEAITREHGMDLSSAVEKAIDASLPTLAKATAKRARRQW